MTDTVTMKQFIADARITMTATRVDRNPANPEWKDADHWKCVFSREYEGTAVYHNRGTAEYGTRKYKAKMTTNFSMGYGHKGVEPTGDQVMDCLISDARCIEWAGFEEWAGDMGYDTDSRKAEKIYKSIEHNTARLKQFLGDDLWEQAKNTERPYGQSSI